MPKAQGPKGAIGTPFFNHHGHCWDNKLLYWDISENTPISEFVKSVLAHAGAPPMPPTRVCACVCACVCVCVNLRVCLCVYGWVGGWLAVWVDGWVGVGGAGLVKSLWISNCHSGNEKVLSYSL